MPPGYRLAALIADDIRSAWLQDGTLPAYGATVTPTHDGSIYLRRGH